MTLWSYIDERNHHEEKGKSYNDYGGGVYCTEHLDLAKEWAVSDGIDGYANAYTIDTVGLRVLNLQSEEYSILHWLALLMHYRKLRLTTPIMKRGAEWLREHFLVDLTAYDVVRGCRADDSYFAFARAFVNNEISLKQLSYAMRPWDLGEQVVLKSQKAFDAIHFVSYTPADSRIYYVKRKARDEAAEQKFVEVLNEMIRRKTPQTQLQMMRRALGYSQRLLAERSGGSLRMIQQYEQRAKDINKATGTNLLGLAYALGCRVEELMEFDTSDVEDDSIE